MNKRQSILDDPAPTQSPPLNYAAAVPLARNRRVQRLAVIAAVCISLIGLGWVGWAGFLRDRIPFWRAWYRSENFAEAPSTVVYTNDRGLVPQLIGSGYSSWCSASSPAGKVVLDACRPAAVRNELWRSFRCGVYLQDPCAFLHWRHTAGQSNRIVAVSARFGLFDWDRVQLRLYPEVFEGSWPPMPHRDPRNDWDTNGLSVIVFFKEQFTLYAGQPDPVDPSHFTIPYSLGRKLGTIEGRLSDGNTAKLTIRDGPLLGRSTDWGAYLHRSSEKK